MLYQGIFNILDRYFIESQLLYTSTDDYFEDLIIKELNLDTKGVFKITESVSEIIKILRKELFKIGFTENDFLYTLYDPNVIIQIEKLKKEENLSLIFRKVFTPLIHELIFEKICEYIVNMDGTSILMNLKKRGIFPIEFLLEIRDIKELFHKEIEKAENFKKYMKIREDIIFRYCESKTQIEGLEYLDETKNKLQLIYLVYRIINFFHLEHIFDFNHIEEYLLNNTNEWLTDVPLVSLRNPEIYYCGIYLVNKFNLNLDKGVIKKYLNDLYEEMIDELESPYMQATAAVYYLFKSYNIARIKLKDEQLKNLVVLEDKYFEPHFLREFDTSTLIVILKMFKMLGIYEKVNIHYIHAIEDEIETRISNKGIIQYRDGPVTSEATCYVLFYKNMMHSLTDLDKFDIVDKIISRIYRNLELIEFSKETSPDLMSEIFYSCESLKLLNVIRAKPMIKQISKYLLPSKVTEWISSLTDFPGKNKRFRNLGVDEITGETIYY